MQKKDIVVLDALTLGGCEVFSAFTNLGNLRVFETTSLEQRKEHIASAEIIITNKVLLDKEIIDACPNLKLICLTATGMNNVDLEHASQKGISVKNVAGDSTESVAQHTFALLLSFLHQTTYYSQYVSSGVYSKSNLFTHIGPGYWELSQKKWGIIGLGAIGRRVAEIATAFSAQVQYYSTSGKNVTQDYPQCSLQELLQTSNIVSIHAPLNDATLDLLQYSDLCLMQKHAILINVGRGGIVNEADLAQALREHKIAGACLDVMQKEPLDIDSPLLSKDIADKLLLTPHVAWISNEALTLLLQKVYGNVEDYLLR